MTGYGLQNSGLSREGGDLFTEVEMSCTSTIGTRSSCLCREVVPGYKCFTVPSKAESLRGVSLPPGGGGVMTPLETEDFFMGRA